MNRRRHGNTVPVLSLATWVVVMIFLCVTGLAYVWLKNDCHRLGDEIKALEREHAQLKLEGEAVATRLATLASTSALRRRYDSDKGRLNGLVPIATDRIFIAGRAPVEADGPEVRAVANNGRGSR